MITNETLEQFSQVMLKYRFTEPLPEDVRRHLRTSKRRQFNLTMKRIGGYSTLFALVANLFFVLKRFGLGVTIVKSAILLGIAVMTTAGFFALTVYWVAFRGAPDPAALNGARERAVGIVSERAVPQVEEAAQEPAAVIEDRIGVQAFSATNLPYSRAAGVSDRLVRGLAGLRGGDRVVNLRFGRGGKKSGMMLLGSVEDAGGVYVITARVVSVKDSRILFYDSETVRSEDLLEGACDRLANKIYSAIK
jgi:hypothetical protein